MSVKIRPRISIVTKLSKQEVQNRISSYIQNKENNCNGWVKEGHAIICASPNQRHIWSPILNLQIDEVENGTELRGVIGPNSSVWTGFVFAFSLLGFLLFVTLMWGLINLSLNHQTMILWLIPVIIFCMFSLYILSKIGQKLSQKEVVELQKFVEKVSVKENKF